MPAVRTEVQNEVAYQNVNMHTLWATPYGNQLPPSQAAKVRCLLHYFDRVTRAGTSSLPSVSLSLSLYVVVVRCMIHSFVRTVPTGKVSFRRLQIGKQPDWASSKTPLSPITVHAEGLIEDEAGALQSAY